MPSGNPEGLNRIAVCDNSGDNARGRFVCLFGLACIMQQVWQSRPVALCPVAERV